MLHIHGLDKRFAGKVLFNEAEAHLGYRSRVALMGPNGAGKSTLTKIILGLESPDAGSVSRAQNLVIGYLPQDLPKYTGGTVFTEVMRQDGRREGLKKTRAELEAGFEKKDPTEAELERYGRIIEELDHLDEYKLEARAKSILHGMGFKTSDFDRDLSEFSGGWLMRVALSRILLMDPDLLLLDEPTNHLDLESLLWLEDFLQSFRGAMLLISHDTGFLNRMVHEVMEIENQRLWVYRGNLDAYVLQKQERLAVMQSQYDSQQAKIAEIEEFVSRFGAKASKARQAQSRVKQLEKMERIEMPEDRSNIRFRFPPAPHSGREVITMKNAGVTYGDKPVFKNLDWVISRGSRTAIVGVNGAGKTTLLKVLSGAIEPTTGEVKPGHAVKTGYYAQMQSESLNPQKTILQELEMVAPDMPMAQVRAIAGAFLFSGDAVQKKCGVLSGGEKARVALAKLLLAPSNFLILDEPTNHLDVESRGVLLEALQNYEGTLCLVSHDREFVSPLVDTVLEIEPTSTGSLVTKLLGGYEDYLARKIKESSEAFKRESISESKSPDFEVSEDLTPQKPSNNKIRGWEREKEKVEAEITKLEKKQADLREVMADPATYEDKEKSKELVLEQRALESELGKKIARWEELCLYLENQ